jgi:hypothetical protein
MEHTASPTLIRGKEFEKPLRPFDVTPEASPGVELRHGRANLKTRPRYLITEGRAVFLSCFGINFAVAWLLDMKYRAFVDDAFSHMANGFYILYSRDQHIAAVGFVWPPLQSIADTILLLGNHLWPALSHNDMAGSLVSALAMAGAAFQLAASLREWGAGRFPRLFLTACFALNPMILLYAGNGMAEGLYVFTLVASTRYLMRWIRSGDLRSLAYSSIALACSYLVRYESVGSLALASLVVGVVSFSRADGPRKSKIKTGLSDLMIFAAPGIITIAGWAVASYVIVGSFFAEFTSAYGNLAQVKNQLSLNFHGRVLYELHSLEALGPFLPLLVVASIAVAITRRDARVSAPIALLGGGLATDLILFLKGDLTASFRYFILAFPFVVFLLGGLVAAIPKPGTGPENATNPPRVRPTWGGFSRAVAAVMLVVAIMVPTAITTWSAMLNPKVGTYEEAQIGWIFHAHPTANDIANKNSYNQVLAIGDWFTSRHLPDGDVLTDAAPCMSNLITTIAQPKLFVIPNDRDYQQILADPISFHTHYILQPDPAGNGGTDIASLYPTLWRTGAGFAKMVHEFPGRSACPAFRLFRVLGHSNEVT